MIASLIVTQLTVFHSGATMKAIAYSQHTLPISDENALYQIELEKPQPEAHDLLVRIEAIAVNPVDSKVRRHQATDTPRILGWDAAGTVESVGHAVTLFKPGDKVFYAGSITRPGCYAEYGLVDERIVGSRPQRLSAIDAAALPLTSLTAWELLFDRLHVARTSSKILLVTGAAGGVGSILVQLARQLTQLTIVATCSRRESAEWITRLGAHHVIDHTQPFAAQLAEIGIEQVDYITSLTHTDHYMPDYVEIIAPQGKLALIDDPATLDVLPLKKKSVSIHWELMFTRSMFTTSDLQRQHEILQQVSQLIDQGILTSTVGSYVGPLSAENLRQAHAIIENGQARGKLVLQGFSQ